MSSSNPFSLEEVYAIEDPVLLDEDESDIIDETSSQDAFLLRLLLLNVDSPLQRNMMLTLYFAICVFSSSPTWFGPQTTLSDIYDVENVTDTFIGNFADADCVGLNAVLRENALLLTLACFEGFKDFLNGIAALSVTGTDVFLSVLSGTAANEDHWGKGPLLYATAATTFGLLFLLNVRNVTELYKRQYRKWYHPEEVEYVACLDAVQIHLRTFHLADQPTVSSEAFGINEFPQGVSLQDQLIFIKNALKNPRQQSELKKNLKRYCDKNGLLNSTLSFYAVDLPSAGYAMIGAGNANYELVNFLIKIGTPLAVIAIPTAFSFYAKSCFYGLALFNIVNLLRNVHPLTLGAIQTSKQDRRYGLVIIATVSGFFMFVPLSGISFCVPTAAMLALCFPNWVEKKSGFYLYGVLPGLGAMGSIANSSGYIGLSTLLLNAFRKRIERNTLSSLDVDESVSDVCTVLDEIKAQVCKETAPNKQFILFLADVVWDSVNRLRERCGNSSEPQPQQHYVSAHVQDPEESHPVLPRSLPYAPAVAYNPQNRSNFWERPSRSHGTFSERRHFSPSSV